MKYIAPLLVLLLFIGEWVSERRYRRVKGSLHQKIPLEIKVRRAVYRTLFLSSMLSLLFAFFLASWNRYGEEPRQGVAIVVDPSHSMSLVQSMADDLLEALPGIPFSLYEISDTGITPLVPPTVDRLFFRILLDGIREEKRKNIDVSATVQEVVHHQRGALPWIVVISGRRLEGPLPEGTSSVVVRPQGPKISVSHASVSFKTLVSTISARLQRSLDPNPVEGMTTLLIAICTVAAWAGYLLWRGYQAPLFLLVLISTPLCGLSKQEANLSCKAAIERAEQEDFQEASEKIESVLAQLSSQQPRDRILYTRSLLAYLQGDFLEAIEWLKMASTGEEKREQLYGLSLISLIQEAQNAKEAAQYKKWLEEWLEKKPPVSKEMEQAARAYLKLEFVDLSVQNMSNTLLWLEDNGAATVSLPPSFFDVVKKMLGEKYPKTMQEAFTSSLSEIQKNPFFSRIWLLIACAQGPLEAIQSLLKEGLHHSGESYLFSRNFEKSEYLRERIVEMISLLPANTKELVGALTSLDADRADLWYGWSTLWPVVQRGGDRATLSFVLGQQMDLPLSASLKTTLSSLAWDVGGFSGSPPEKDPLESVFQKALFDWYAHNPQGALDLLIYYVQQRPKTWAKRVFRFITPLIAQEHDSTLISAVAQALKNKVEQYSPVAVALLWQLATQKEDAFKEQIDTLITLFETQAVPYSLIMKILPDLEKQLREGSELFTGSKKKKYLSLLEEWVELCSLISQKLSSKREIDREVSEAIDVLYALRALFDEDVLSGRPDVVLEELFYKEDAVRLYQEMDRSDRALWE